MGGGVDKVGVGDQGGRKANGRTVECDNQNLGVRVEGAGNVKIIGNESANQLAANTRAQLATWSDASDICPSRESAELLGR